ncbi:hypothetical protein [Haloarcula sediminis]|uniref:hypothetical protein n=1 Tax=Haloarcula sediminis TaxID=3111777 RepID=UPI002D76F416|nr:hypothetical protein [Haloarcula sp. CK38]
MPKTILKTIDELLAGIEEDVDSSETIYKARNARQLIQVLLQRRDDLDEAIDETVTDDEIVENLRDLGYLE